jgi:hypothetical protein
MNKAFLIRVGLIGVGAVLGIIIHQNLPASVKMTIGS